MMAKDISGNEPAFPGLILGNESTSGMTWLDYFAAHAPIEPQEWFDPTMRSKPLKVDRPDPFGDDTTSEQFKRQSDLYDAWSDAYRLWLREKAKERLLQWPWAWAREMIARRDK